jgi:hypothetical protein
LHPDKKRKKKKRKSKAQLWGLITCVKQDQPALHEKSACITPQALVLVPNEDEKGYI